MANASSSAARAVILGSSFREARLTGMALTAERVLGATLYRYCEHGWVLPRHGLPHATLPHRIDYRANLAALAAVGVKSLLVTSSVGVMDATLPLMTPLVVTDLFMLDNRLPDGSACTVFVGDDPGAHLVLDDGIVSTQLSAAVRAMITAEGFAAHQRDVVFGYVQGPRTKTAAENAYLVRAGVHVNSMSVGPELVLANELAMSCAAVVVGHKHSRPASAQALHDTAIGASLERARDGLERIAARFLREAPAVPFANHLYRFT